MPRLYCGGVANAKPPPQRLCANAAIWRSATEGFASRMAAKQQRQQALERWEMRGSQVVNSCIERGNIEGIT
jgi:hypothetical protein